jgi:predicted negative regulator of RcsB-dependent stress response
VAALALLVAGDDEIMNYTKAELKGDILLNDKDFLAAVEAYEQAESLASTLQIRVSQTLELKLNHAKSFL